MQVSVCLDCVDDKGLYCNTTVGIFRVAIRAGVDVKYGGDAVQRRHCDLNMRGTEMHIEESPNWVVPKGRGHP